jgi:peptide/nickel transport system permease protein
MMLRYTVQRLILMVPALVAIAALIFLIVQLPPGDYLSNEIVELKSQGDDAGAKKAEYLRHEYSLDRPSSCNSGFGLGRGRGRAGSQACCKAISVIRSNTKSPWPTSWDTRWFRQLP